MTIIIGLGNPGEQYKNTRHNVGFTAVDEIATNFQFPIFNLKSTLNSETSEGEINGKKVILAKPQTFMNESGKAVKKIIENKPVENLIVIHDDIDLPVGKIKIVEERGSAGHKGVESIIQSIGNKGLIRIRVGIAPSQTHGPICGSIKAKKIVLKNFSKEEKELIDSVIKKIAEAIGVFLSEGIGSAMNKFN